MKFANTQVDFVGWAIMSRQHLAAGILMASSLMLLLTAAAASDQHCCLPPKWYASMVKTNHKVIVYSRPYERAEKAEKPMQVDVFVNYRKPQFELRYLETNRSLVLWRGHMWMFTGTSIQLLDPPYPGYRPSKGLAPFYFRCFAEQNGFQKVDDGYYRLLETFNVSGYDGPYQTVTDIIVRPTKLKLDSIFPTCLLWSVGVTAYYPKYDTGRRRWTTVLETQNFHTNAPSTPSWPDKSFTERLRGFLPDYRHLRRLGKIQLSQPHLSVPVLGTPIRARRPKQPNQTKV